MLPVFLSKNPVLRFINDSIYDAHAYNFWLKKINTLASVNNEMLARIVDKKMCSQDMLSLTLHCNRYVNFGQAGQHHLIKANINGRNYERSYSLTQLDSTHLQLHVKKVPQGIVSTWLCEQAKIGDTLALGQPFGGVQIHNFNCKNLVLLAAGSGITPIYSLIHDLVQKNQLRDYQTQLFYWAKTQADLAFVAQFTAWQQRYSSQFKVHFFTTQQAPFHPRLNHQSAHILGDLSQSSVFACGSADFVNNAAHLAQTAQQFQGEAFHLNTASQLDPHATVQLRLEKSKQTLSIPKGQSILAALEAAKIPAKHGCRMGICNSCSCKKMTGSSQNLQNFAVNHEPNQMLRICVHSAQSDLVLDL